MGAVSGSGHLPQTSPRAFSRGRRHIYSESLINVLFILFRSLYGKLDAAVRSRSGDSACQLNLRLGGPRDEGTKTEILELFGQAGHKVDLWPAHLLSEGEMRRGCGKGRDRLRGGEGRGRAGERWESDGGKGGRERHRKQRRVI